MMTVSTNEYVPYTLNEMTIITPLFFFPKELLVRWARDVYEFNESQIVGTVELVTDSTFEVYTHDYVCHYPYFLFKGVAIDATIERAFVRVPALLFNDSIFGNAQVTRKTL